MILRVLFINPWYWWAAGLGIGCTALILYWLTGRRLGAVGGYEDVRLALKANPTSPKLTLFLLVLAVTTLTGLISAYINNEWLGLLFFLLIIASILLLASWMESTPLKDRWQFWLILGLPIGAFIANAGHWNWTWLFGRLDGLTYGLPLMKIPILLIAGALVGFGARWAGGSIWTNLFGLAQGNKMTVLSTAALLVAGILFANFLFSFIKVF